VPAQIPKLSFLKFLQLQALEDSLDFIKLDPKNMLCLSPSLTPSEIEQSQAWLQQRYPDAQCLFWPSHLEALDLALAPFDLILAFNIKPRLCLKAADVSPESQWELLFHLIQALLGPKGLFLISQINPTQKSQGNLDKLDLMLLGDLLLKTGFLDPVVDRDNLPFLKAELIQGLAWAKPDPHLSRPDPSGHIYFSADLEMLNAT